MATCLRLLKQCFTQHKLPLTRKSLLFSLSLSTFPPNFPSDAPKRIIFGSCSDASLDLSYWDTFQSLKPDLVILMGDNVYGRSSTLGEEYQKLSTNPAFQRAKEELCIIAALDDNDYGDGTNSGSSQGESAIALFKDLFCPNLVNSRAAYQSYQWNHQIQIIILDLRCSSSPRLCGIETGRELVPDYRDKTKTWLGEEQWDWLEQEMDKDVQLRIIVSPLQVLTTAHSFDCWNQLPYERIRLLNLLNIKSKCQTLLLSGDRHVSALYCQDGQYEITSSSLTHTVPHQLLEHEVDLDRISPFTYDNNFGMLELSRFFIHATIRCVKSGRILQDWELLVPQGVQSGDIPSFKHS